MKKRFLRKIIIVSALTFVVQLAVSVPTFASGGIWGSGGSSPSGGGGGGGAATYNCENPLNDNCPHWIKADISTFTTAWNNQGQGTGYSEEVFKVCTNTHPDYPNANTDGYVIFTGIDNKDASRDGRYSNIRLYNLYPSPFRTNYKLRSSQDTWQNISVAGSGYSRTYHNFFNDSTVAYPDKDYSWVMGEVMSLTGLNEGELAFFCAGLLNLNNGASVQSRAGVKVDNDGWVDSEWDGSTIDNTHSTTSENVSVSFRHFLRRNDGTPVDASVNASWSVTSTGPTSVSVASPSSGTQALAKGASSQVHTTTATVSVPEGGSVTVCQTIKYNPKTFSIASDGTTTGSGEGFSQACVTIGRDVPPVTPLNCPLPNSNYTINYGSTQAQSGVRNITKSATWTDTSSNGQTVAVWAKPGDSIQFRHTLCYGAQAVRGGSTRTGRDSYLAAPQNTASIVASTTPASSGNYLFGKTLTGTNIRTFNLTRGQSIPADVSGADETGNYYFTYYSPSVKAGNSAASTFKCYSSSLGGLGYASFKNNGYQIPSFASTMANCDSGNNVAQYSDVGKKIEQKLNWNNVVAYVNKHTTSYGGTCGARCPDNSAYARNSSNDYAGAVSATSNGSIGERFRYCTASGQCVCGEYCRDTNYVGPTDYTDYPVSTPSAASFTQTAQVKIPFNYTSSLTTTLDNNNGVVYGGEDTGITASISIKPRVNPDTGTYATITKPSKYQVVSFIVSSRTGTPSSSSAFVKGNDSVSGSQGSNACTNFYGSSSKTGVGGVSACTVISENSNLKEFNTKGSLNSGSTEFVLSGGAKVKIPDLAVGTKFCVAIGFWPSNSHNKAGTITTSDNEGAGLSTTGTTWNYSGATCMTISKKPSVQFWGQGVYSAGSIITSSSKKNVGNTTHGLSDGTRTVFGSWSEYEAVALKNIVNFGTGAGYGYELNNKGSLSGIGGYKNVGFDSEPAMCVYSSQTITNDECAATKTIGYSNINNVNIGTLLTRLRSRYTDTNKTTYKTSSSVELDLEGVCVFNTRTGKYEKSVNSSNFTCLENGAKYIRVEGNATIGLNSKGNWYCMVAGDNVTSRTSIVDVTGTLRIYRNFRYGNTSSSNCGVDAYSSIAELPQQFFFAKNIEIYNDVTNLDGWLVAEENINTCANVATNSDPKTKSGLTSSVCNSQLTINGPVFASQVLLNRTYGAGTGNASIQPSEIFNLRSDTYLWAYAQAQRFSQAVTTYSRELAPRY